VSERLAGGWTVEESGPLRARVRLEAGLGAARVRWWLSLHAGDPVLRMALEVLWGERFKLLQLALQLAEPPRRWTDALPGGAVERTPGRAEWPVGGWSRVRAGDADLALVTPDAASLSLAGRTWQWTLLRAPKMAWGGGRPAVDAGRAVHTDQGVHAFALDLHAGPELTPGRLDAAVRALAAPPVVVERAAGVARPPWGADPPAHLHGPAEERARGAAAPPPAAGDALFAPITRRTEEDR